MNAFHSIPAAPRPSPYETVDSAGVAAPFRWTFLLLLLLLASASALEINDAVWNVEKDGYCCLCAGCSIPLPGNPKCIHPSQL